MTYTHFSAKNEAMMPQWIKRAVRMQIQRHLERGKSLLLLGPRQTGKTSCLQQFSWDLEISFLLQRTRLEYEKNPDVLLQYVEALSVPLPKVLIDEVQKVPAIMDVVQYLIDKKKAQFALTGSSARRLKNADAVNFLPGRIVLMRMDPLTLSEFQPPTVEDALFYGSLPAMVLTSDPQDREIDLDSYATTFLEEEIRKEALVRNVPAFARFLELAAIDSGEISNFAAIARQVGVAHTTIAQHYQILEDCLLVERFDPITTSSSRKKLTRSSRYLFFDLGVRRLAAGEGTQLIPERIGRLFEQYVGLELRREQRAKGLVTSKVQFWRDPHGPEVDWVLTSDEEWIPVEVKWSDSPAQSDARHVELFLDEYAERAKRGYVVCRGDAVRQLTPRVKAIPWQQIPTLVEFP
ncbi:ATP-binding protein [bacterium]|nr:ATP-binding protein [bacterium]